VFSFLSLWSFQDELCSSLCGVEGDLAAGQQWRRLKTVPRKGHHRKKPTLLRKSSQGRCRFYPNFTVDYILHPDVDFDMWEIFQQLKTTQVNAPLDIVMVDERLSH